MLSNLDAADRLQVPICQDCGMAVVFLEVGQEVHFVDGDLYTAVNEGVRGFEAIAIAGGPEDADTLEFCPPCGICRQVMREFCVPEHFRIILGNSKGEIKSRTLAELLPDSFGPEDL